MANMHSVHGPRLRTEELQPYYELAPDVMERSFGVRPSRTTLYGYLTHGFPVRRGGPWLKMPVVDDPVSKRPYTSERAMQRWIRRLRKLQRQYPRRA